MAARRKSATAASEVAEVLKRRRAPSAGEVERTTELQKRARELLNARDEGSRRGREAGWGLGYAAGKRDQERIDLTAASHARATAFCKVVTKSEMPANAILTSAMVAQNGSTVVMQLSLQDIRHLAWAYAELTSNQAPEKATAAATPPADV